MQRLLFNPDMKKTFLLFQIYILFSICCWGIPSTTEEINFTPLKNHIQLPTNEIRNLFQDKEGYIWIATYNGLVRYDGYSTKIYHAESENTEKSIDGFINIVAEDDQSNLWIGTHNGLYKLNKKHETIEKIHLPNPQVSNVEAVTCTREGTIWAGTNKGLFVRKKMKKILRYIKPFKTLTSSLY